MDIDYLRQLEIFNPKDFKDRKVTVVGTGATGSYVVSLLAQIGIKNISAWDFDIVEEHNLPNQIYTIKQIGMPKVEALKELVKEKSGFEIEIHNERVVDQITNPGNYFFLLTDTMASRREIFEKCIQGRAFNTDLVIETRMDAIDPRLDGFALAFQFFGRPHVVGVEEGDPLAPRFLDSPVAGRRLAPIGLPEHAHRRAKTLGHRRRVIGRAVVHHEDLLRRPRLTEYRAQSLRQEARSVVAGDDDGDRRIARHERGARDEGLGIRDWGLRLRITALTACGLGGADVPHPSPLTTHHPLAPGR